MTDEAVDKGEKQPARSERSDARVAGMLVRQQTVVLLVDLVESVRLMREHEAITVRRWADFVRTVTAEILPRHRGERRDRYLRDRRKPGGTAGNPCRPRRDDCERVCA
jgi:class 3 adenylate cyclase